MKIAKKRCATPLSAALAAFGLVVFLSAAPAWGVDTLSSGAGRDDRAVRHPRFSLKVVFAERQGAFVAGVAVKITGEDGRTLVDDSSAGPWFYADLPPGTYEVRAQHGAARTMGTVEVGGGRQKVLYLTFRTRG